MKILAPLVTIVALAGSAGANADPSGRAPMADAARQQFDRGAALYQAGEYAAAIATFEQGQRLDPHPDFLYALAQAYRKQGDCSRAIALYQAFLATRPPTTEAARARANLERCPLAPAPTPPSTPLSIAPSPVPPAAPAATGEDGGTPWYRDTFGDALLATGLVAAGVGATYLVLGNSAHDEAGRAANLADVERLVGDGVRDRKIGTWCLAGGGAFALAALARYALRSSPPSGPDRAVRVVPRAGSILVAWEARF